MSSRPSKTWSSLAVHAADDDEDDDKVEDDDEDDERNSCAPRLDLIIII